MMSAQQANCPLPKLIFDGSFYWERIFQSSQYAPHFDSNCMRPVIDSDGNFPVKAYEFLSQFDTYTAVKSGK